MTDLDIPDTGAVFTFGKSRFAENKPSHFFIKNDPVVQISCGDEHTAVICKNGRIFAFGNNEWGQLGLGHNNMIHKPSCVKTLKPEKAKFIACGRAHTIILTESNNVYACGSNTDGQLGLENIDIVNNPTKIQHPLLTDNGVIKKLSAGSQHSAALTESGKLFVWGSNSEGQLGLESNKTSCRVPTQLEFKDKIKDVSCGYYHTAVVTESGDLFTFGENENGKLGLPASDKQTYKPTRVSIDARIRSISCGGNHNLCVTEAGTVWAFGSNVFGELGLERRDSATAAWVNPPREIPKEVFGGEMIKEVTCGENHTAFVTENNKIYTCGDPRHGKLCQDETDDQEQGPKQVTRFQNYKVIFVACGGCHTILSAQKSEEDTSTLPPLQRIPNFMLNEDNNNKITSAIPDLPDKLENGVKESFEDSLDPNALMEDALQEIDDTKETISEMKLPESVSEKILTQSEELKREYEKKMSDAKETMDEIKNDVPDVKGKVNGLIDTMDDLMEDDNLGETVVIESLEATKLKDVIKTDLKFESVDNLLQEIEDDLSGSTGTTSSDTISVKSIEKKMPEVIKDPEVPKPEMKPTEIVEAVEADEEDLKMEEPVIPTERRISKFFNTFRRKKISATDTTKIEETMKEGMESAENLKAESLQKLEKSKTCIIL